MTPLLPRLRPLSRRCRRVALHDHASVEGVAPRRGGRVWSGSAHDVAAVQGDREGVAAMTALAWIASIVGVLIAAVVALVAVLVSIPSSIGSDDYRDTYHGGRDAR